MINSPDSSSSSTDCDALSALIPAYVLGATDPEETRFVERHLQGCPDALADLRAYSDLQDALLLASPYIEAPAALASALQQRIHDEKLHPAHPVQPVSVMETRQSANVKRPSPRLRPNSRRTTWLTGGIAAALTLLFITNFYWMLENNRMTQEASTAQSLRSERNVAIAALSAGDTQIAPLSDPGDGHMSGAIVWSSEKQMAMLSVANLPDTTADQEYQLWFMAGDEEVSMGTFRVQPDGMGLMIFELDHAIEQFDAFGVTLEPTGGSQTPTTALLLMGKMEK